MVQTEGSRQVTRDTKHYNLQMIIAVGFKVNSERAVQFRKESMLPVLLFT
nr:RhuM family protein [Blautia sp. SF-50]